MRCAPAVPPAPAGPQPCPLHPPHRLPVHRLPTTTTLQDRTPFAGLVAVIADFLRQEVPACPPTRPIYVLGESFGGLLALAVAAGEGPWA